ncbi:hypothetical protein LPJ64_002769 [Coemansia asiatica]|uniref:PUM-HD domain-containing protein n=1 Tax=Coemansia asiatica TaxID=1052880 RepID=A0A9W7XMA8_9FUNG|nr:hypothetical protein LPJ64_002769 [Coemansia asiatica]
MSGPKKPFDPFGSAAALAAADTKDHKSSPSSAKTSGFRAKFADRKGALSASVSPGSSSAESSSSTSPTSTAINTNANASNTMAMSSVVTTSNSSNSSTASNESASTNNAGAFSTATAATTLDSSVLASGSGQMLAGVSQPLKHSSIFEIGGEPFTGEHSNVSAGAAVSSAGVAAGASASSRLSRIVGASNNGGAAPSLSTTSSPMSMLPLGPTIMGSPHSLFNDSTYGVAGTSSLSMAAGGARGGHTPSSAQLGHHAKAHRLSQSRFNSILGDAGLQTSIIGRVGDKDSVSSHIANGSGTGPSAAGQGILDMSAGMLDSMKSQQASPSNAAQTSFKDFYVKSLPVSRRNSQEFQNLWQELEGFSINENSTHPAINMPSIVPNSHLAGLDGHSIAARNSSGAFRKEDNENMALMWTSPKLPQGLLDDDILSIKPKQQTIADIVGGPATDGSTMRMTKVDMASVSVAGANASGLSRGSTTNLAHVSSGVDLVSTGLFNNAVKTAGFSSIAANASVFGVLGQQNAVNSDSMTAENIGDLRMYDPSRGVNLIRNASTPVLNTKQYQVLQTAAENMGQSTGIQGRGGAVYADANANANANANSNARFDIQSQMYGNAQYKQAFAANNEIASGRHNPGVSSYQYPANAQGMTIGRNNSFVISHPAANGAAMQVVNGGYNGQASFGPSNAASATASVAGGMYGVGTHNGHPSVPPTPHQHPLHGSSHIHLHSQQPQQQKAQQQKIQQQKSQQQPQLQQQQQQSQRSQRQMHGSHQQSSISSKQPASASASTTTSTPVAATAAASTSFSASASGQQSNQAHSNAASGSLHHQKHGANKGSRRNEGDANKFANVTLEELQGTIFDVCRDQYGCRFLQKLLEEGKPNQFEIIFNEATERFSELMTDPFGNYLCQKLFEHCNETQRTQIIRDVAPSLVEISLNMHGTRAVQKMIESLSSQDQIEAVISALHDSVVMLIRDLNGNHVIQKCLSQLSSKNNQFIYDSVAQSCSEVATHRQGCCVFQRCIDYSTGEQKRQLVDVVIDEALALVQDPFGNYVVQYVLELGVSEFSEPLIKRFNGHICGLSVQKFSSNVMEKCIRIASADTRRQLVVPLLQREKLEILMRDSYGNYVVQTALDFADQTQRLEIIEAILPLLPHIRHTPYGKRIYIKLQRDGFVSAVPSAAGSHHASPTLGPMSGGHANAALSSMPLYSQLALPTMNGSIAQPPANAGPALSRGVSPLTGNSLGNMPNGKQQQSGGQPRMYAPPGAAGANGAGMYQHQAGHSAGYMQIHPHAHHPGGIYYYNLAGIDGSGPIQQQHQHQHQQQQQHGIAHMTPNGHVVTDSSSAHQDHQQVSSVVQIPLSAPSLQNGQSAVPSGPPGAKLQTTSYYGAR